MKPLCYLLLAVFLLPLSTPLSAAPDRYEKQGATLWVKEETTRLKKTLTLLKRVKDERSAEKAGKALLEMYGDGEENTALGKVGPAELPKGEAVATAVARNIPRLTSLERAIEAQRQRIEALELESTTMARALEVLGRVPSVAEADYSAPAEEAETEEQ